MILVLLVLPCNGVAIAQEMTGRDSPLPLTVRITSPLGRTGLAGSIRIVAQVSHAPSVAVQSVRFYVNNELLGEDGAGPPFAVEWADDNPFEKTEISAEATDATGRSARDTVRLEPFEVTETTEVASVLLEASIQDRTGRYVSGLGTGALLLSEDEVTQTIDLVRPETLPTVYTLLVDASHSMHRRMDAVRNATSKILGILRPGDKVVVAPFTTKIGAITGPTDDVRTVGDAITAIQSSGGTAILDGLSDTAKLVSGIDGRRAVVLITDGYDEDSAERVENAVAALQAAKATVYVVGIAGVAGISLKGERFLRDLAASTGGKAVFPSRDEELLAAYGRVADDIQCRYLITYTPLNQKVDGTWRSISLTTIYPELVVRTRPGYFAPSPPPIRPSIEFTIRGRDREYYDVAADDLLVFEDGVEQRVDTFQEAVDPVSIVMLLDQSGSMVKASEAVKAAARSFVAALRPEDSLAVAMFSDGLLFAHDLTKNRDHSIDAIGDYTARGGTALYDALHGAFGRLKSVAGRRVVVVLTDGRDENNPGTAPGSVHTIGDVLRGIKESRTTVFTIGLGPKVDEPVLAQIARESGGEVFLPADVTALEGDYQRIVENLRRRYVVAYTSTNSVRDGAWRNVEIKTVQENRVAESAGGYFAPER